VSAAAFELVQEDGPIWRVTNGIFPSNCYLCGTGVPGECFIVDPGLEASPIEAALGALGLVPQAVLCTHGHFDHAGSAAYFQAKYDCKVYLDAGDMKTLRSSNFLLMAFKIQTRIALPEVTDVREQGSVVQVGNAEVRFHPTPGHTPGSCVLEYSTALFTGDTLYSRGLGLSKLPGEEPEILRRSIISIWDRFSADTMVHPGHGDAAALGWIQQNNLPLLRFLRPESSPAQLS